MDIAETVLTLQLALTQIFQRHFEVLQLRSGSNKAQNTPAERVFMLAVIELIVFQQQ